MKRPERIKSFLVITIFLFLVVWPAYLQYNGLIELDMLSPNAAFENLDPNKLIAEKQEETNLLVSAVSPPVSFFGFSPIASLAYLSLHIFFSDQSFSVLRC
jgi:hypothetical protein